MSGQDTPQVPIDPAVPVDVWEQNVSIGGTDAAGALPKAAVPTAAVGVAQVREAPVLRHIIGKLSGVNNDVVRLAGYQPQRRWVIITATIQYMVCDSKHNADVSVGMTVTTDQPWSLWSSAEIWLRFQGNGDVGYVLGMDEG